MSKKEIKRFKPWLAFCWKQKEKIEFVRRAWKEAGGSRKFKFVYLETRATLHGLCCAYVCLIAAKNSDLRDRNRFGGSPEKKTNKRKKRERVEWSFVYDRPLLLFFIRRSFTNNHYLLTVYWMAHTHKKMWFLLCEVASDKALSYLWLSVYFASVS